jgi:hypothetical protein
MALCDTECELPNKPIHSVFGIRYFEYRYSVYRIQIRYIGISISRYNIPTSDCHEYRTEQA